MRRLVLATRNPGKVRELNAILSDLTVEVVSIGQWPELPEPVEDGDTFAANALLKARAAAAGTGLPAVADDSGLVVDALDGAPGVLSARYGGPGLDDDGRNAHLLGQLAARGVTASPGRFVCVAALVTPGGVERVFEAAWEGVVTGPPQGDNGFGYDPLFLLPERGCRSAELPPAEKNAISHRGRAFRALAEALRAEPGLLGNAAS